MRSLRAALLALPLLAVGCIWQTDLPAGATSIPVDPSRELVVTDEDLLSGPLAQNESAGPLSFAEAIGQLPLEPGAALQWLQAWSQRLKDERYPDRAMAFDRQVTCPWLHAAPENRCDRTCAACRGQTLRLDAAPFRLIAVANRTDLSVMPARAADGGEGRLVFAVTEGPGDDPGSPSLPLTVIFEYAQQGTALQWTQQWHALGQASDADFPASLVALTQTFVASGTLAQIRTADALTGPMVLHQFHIESGALVATNVRNTPDWNSVPQSSMTSFASDDADAIQAGTALFPQSWWAADSFVDQQPPAYVPALPQGELIAQMSCGGCHALSANGFQIDPTVRGDGKLSRFLVDPSQPQDEMRRRVLWMQLTLWQGS